MTEDEQFESYTALRFGEVIDEGPTPIPDNVRKLATEIRWGPVKSSDQTPTQ